MADIKTPDKIAGPAKTVLVDDIDTDQIFHASLLTIHEPEKIKPHIFGNLDGFHSFGEEDHAGKIMVVGKNFGKGSTRQQAVTGFLAHGIKALVGLSFGPIYYGNAVNAGLLCVELAEQFEVVDGDEVEIDVPNSQVHNKTKGTSAKTKLIPRPALEIMEAGGLLELGKRK